MKNELLASLTITSLLVCASSLAAGDAVDLAVTAAAVRKADEDWAAAANAGSVGKWMSFYAAQPLVLLPDGETTSSGVEPVREAVSRLLTRPHVSIAIRPIEATVARSGDLAFLVEAYELRFDDPNGMAVSDRGRRLEIWRRQADGGFKCIVDTWSVDGPIAPSSSSRPPALPAPALPAPLPPAPPLSAQTAAPNAESAAPLAQGQPLPPAAVLESGPPAPARGAATKYGDMPNNYEELIRKYFLEHLKHPESVQYMEITRPQQGYTTEVTGGLLMREKREYGWTVKAAINARDSHYRYVGFKTYTFLFRGEKIVDARLPLPGDEMN